MFELATMILGGVTQPFFFCDTSLDIYSLSVSNVFVWNCSKARKSKNCTDTLSAGIQEEKEKQTNDNNKKKQ